VCVCVCVCVCECECECGGGGKEIFSHWDIKLQSTQATLDTEFILLACRIITKIETSVHKLLRKDKQNIFFLNNSALRSRID
jgi:hypothetical protein